MAPFTGGAFRVRLHEVRFQQSFEPGPALDRGREGPYRFQATATTRGQRVFRGG